MRRILFPVLIIGLTAGLFSLGSGAFFSDVETSVGNDFDAGTLDLTPDNAEAAICTITNFAPDNLNPAVANDVSFDGPYGGTDCSLTVTNVGSLAGDLYLTVAFTGDLDVDCTEPELLVDTTCNAATNTTGELDDQLDVSVCSADVTDGTEAGDPCADQGKLAALAFSCAKVADLDATSGAYAFTFDMDSDDVDNASQGDAISVELTFELQQDGAPSPC